MLSPKSYNITFQTVNSFYGLFKHKLQTGDYFWGSTQHSVWNNEDIQEILSQIITREKNVYVFSTCKNCLALRGGISLSLSQGCFHPCKDLVNIFFFFYLVVEGSHNRHALTAMLEKSEVHNPEQDYSNEPNEITVTRDRWYSAWSKAKGNQWQIICRHQWGGTETRTSNLKSDPHFVCKSGQVISTL